MFVKLFVRYLFIMKSQARSWKSVSGCPEFPGRPSTVMNDVVKIVGGSGYCEGGYGAPMRVDFDNLLL